VRSSLSMLVACGALAWSPVPSSAAERPRTMIDTTAISDRNLQSCVSGSVRIAIVEVVKPQPAKDPASDDPEQGATRVVVKVLEMLGPGRGSGRWELDARSNIPLVHARPGQDAVVAVSPYRGLYHTAEGVVAALLIPEGRRREVTEEIRRRLDRFRPRLSDDTLRSCATGRVDVAVVEITTNELSTTPPDRSGPDRILTTQLVEAICGSRPPVLRIVRRDRRLVSLRPGHLVAVATSAAAAGAMPQLVDFEPIYDGGTAAVVKDLRTRIAALGKGR
jgi:hypothetical protein